MFGARLPEIGSAAENLAIYNIHVSLFNSKSAYGVKQRCSYMALTDISTNRSWWIVKFGLILNLKIV